MKRGLDETALPRMKLAFAGEQPIAQQHAGAYQHAALGEVSLMSDEHVFNRIRMAERVKVLRTEPEMDQVAVFAGDLQQKLWRVFSKLL
ncbi:MAG: hypothetical protein ABSB35_40250 [Bryobacteraceae bacterium]|jgi:hypothetical protein